MTVAAPLRRAYTGRMAVAKPHVDVRGILQSHSRKLLNEFREDERTTPSALDRGKPREDAVRTFLKSKLPGRYGVGDGIVIDREGGQSFQCDVVIYDWERTPRLSTDRPESLTIWPFEYVYGIAEVKSKLTEAAFKEAVKNIAAFKKLVRPANDLVGGGGVYTYADVQNPELGILIAHEWGDDLQPEASKFDAILTSVPREQQLDVFCIISGSVGCRARVEDGPIIGVFPPGEDVPLAFWELGEGALAWFTLVLITLLNGIRLGDRPSLLAYLKYLEANKP